MKATEMKKRMTALPKIVLCALVLAPWLLGSSLADEIVLKSGIKIQGNIVEADAMKVVVETAGGKRMTYMRASVAEIRSAQSEDLARADKLLKGGHMVEAQKVLESVAASGGLMKSDAQVRLIQCYFRTGKWEKGVALYLSVLNAEPAAMVAAGFPWNGIGPEQAEAVLKGVSAAGQLAGTAAGIADVVKAWAKCAKDPSADLKAALGGAAASQEAVVSDAAAVAQMQLMCQRKDYDGCLAFIQKRLAKLDAAAQPWGHYWRGRCLLAKEDLERAALAFLRVGLTSENSGALAGDSLFMAATCFEKKRESDRALGLYGEVAQDYPLALSADEARKKAGAEK